MNTRLPVSLNDADLDDHRQRLEHEHAADDAEQQFLLDQNGDGAERGAERQRSDVAHEDLRRVRVEPEESERRADQRAAEDRQLRRLRKPDQQQVVGEHAVAGDVRQRRVRRRGDRERADRQTVEAVGQVDGVRHTRPARTPRTAGSHQPEIRNQPLEERKDQPRVVGAVSAPAPAARRRRRCATSDLQPIL